MSFLKEYKQLIDDRQVIVGYWIRREIENLIADMEDPRYVFAPEQVEKRIKFMERCCLQSKAPYYMKPIELMPWQKAWWEALYGFRMKETGKRRFNEGLLEIARKNGKSTMCAADGNYDLFVGEGGADICVASNDDKQAKIIWRELAGMRSRLDVKNSITRQNLVELRNTAKNITVFRMSARMRSLDGYNISKTYLDESHDIAEEGGASELADACWRGMSSKEEPLFINCTSQGRNRECYLDKKIAYGKSVIEGEIDDPHFLPFLFEQDSEQEVWQNEASWEKANPSIRYGVKKIDKLRRDVEMAKTDKATRILCLTKDFNIPQTSAQSWLMLEDFDYMQPVTDLEEFRGALILGATDLSATTDLSNIRILIMRPNDPIKYMYTMYFIPEEKLRKSDDRAAGANYREWAKQGYLTIHEGSEVDISAIPDWLLGLYKQYKLRPYVTGYDQRFAKPFLEKMQNYGFRTEMLAQGRALSNAMKLTEAELKSKRINFGGNPIDKWCLQNCCCEVDNVGNIQPVKIRGQHSKRIDGALTMIMLMEIYRRYRADYMRMINTTT